MNELDKLINDKNQGVNALRELNETIKKEKRNFSSEELEKVERIKKDVNDLNTRIENERFIMLNEEKEALTSFRNDNSKEETNVKRNFNLFKAVSEINGRGLTGLELEISKEGQKEIRDYAQQDFSNGIVLPSWMLSKRADITTTANPNFSITNQAPYLSVVNDRLIFDKIGVTVYDNLVGVLDAPNLAQMTASFATEDNTYSNLSMIDGKTQLLPRFLPASQSFTRQFLSQTSQTLQNQLINQYVFAINKGLETELFTQIGNLPAFNSSYSGTTKTLSFSGITAAEGSLPYADTVVTSRKLMGKLKSRQQDSIIGKAIWDNNLVDGMPAFASTNVNDNLLIVGDFQTGSAIGYWGGLIIINDPYSNKQKGNIDIQVARLCDAKVVNKNAFALIKNAI